MKKKNLAKNIKTLRIEKGWTQEELAEKSGVTYTTIIKLEQGVVDNPTLKTLESLAMVFSVTLDDLTQ
ncbi:helix-turn-helix transcriptional regulator [Candidatus Nomurabacteria bacterium]|nr:helix-turn-helix transcriptional regulator [Candidatus Nomurabacteria bacterium]MCB9803815.1 helix-turn-helix transcriptional regulator [Candidatus Nomurabacteria bacterium]